jgi:hypothetical protein
MISEGGILEPLPEEEYISLQNKPVILKMDLPLYPDISSETASILAKNGESTTLVKTDNKEWILIRTQNGESGWFQIKDYYYVVIGSELFFSTDVFEGLYIGE